MSFQLLLMQALSLRSKGQFSEALGQVEKCLELQPDDFFSRLIHAEILRAIGFERSAYKSYKMAIFSPSAQAAQEIENMRKALAEARRYTDAYEKKQCNFIEAELDLKFGAAWRLHKRFFDSFSRKFHGSIDTAFNDQEFTLIDLPSTGFFDPNHFPWLENIHNGWERILSELRAFLQNSNSFVPYVQYSNIEPLDQWSELNYSPNWGAYHLIQAGTLLPDAARYFPKTLELVSGLPQPKVEGKSPVMLISRLAPKAHIPAHVGISNSRLLVHVPLIVPEKCDFRVGGEVRTWQSGVPWVFDDTTEHEAWNNSDFNRYILIFDVWHPDLSADERLFIECLGAAEHKFNQQFS